MKMITLFLLIFWSLSSLANPACGDFVRIKNVMTKLDKGDVGRILPNAEWLDEKYRRQDRMKAVGLVGKTVVLLMLKRLTFMSYLFEPTRAGVSSFTGYYVSSPENFVKFLSLESRSACRYLSMGDSHAALLRELTHKTWIELDQSRR